LNTVLVSSGLFSLGLFVGLAHAFILEFVPVAFSGEGTGVCDIHLVVILWVIGSEEASNTLHRIRGSRANKVRFRAKENDTDVGSFALAIFWPYGMTKAT
jgi:hypothetical protein